jgi:anti-sigma regulatory factor (Ser/Thr protein kinase)
MTGPMSAQTRGFEPDTSSVRSARAFVHEAVGDEVADPEVLALLVSELVSNAIIHAGSPFEVVVSTTEDGVRVGVRDESEGLPVVRAPDRLSPSGRGLMIVDRLASGWGVDAEGPGKTVWFELDR